MTSFHQQSFQSRLGAMGDESEAIFDELFTKNHKLGLNRPPVAMSGVKLEMRYVPDRQVRDAFVECMGVGRDRLLKMKSEKFDALFVWTMIGPVDLFVWDSHAKNWYRAPIKDWYLRAAGHGIVGHFPEGKEYIALHVDHFPVPPTPYVKQVAA
jgi:hypothetical protein